MSSHDNAPSGGGADHARTTNYALWAVQVALALLFVFAGGIKLVLPADDLTKDAALSATFLRFIGVCEVLGAIGLIVPGLLRFKPGLMPLAAAGLVIIMIGATTVTGVEGSAAAAMFPLVVGLFAAFVAFGRWRLAPHRARVTGPFGSRAGARSVFQTARLGDLAGWAADYRRAWEQRFLRLDRLLAELQLKGQTP